MSIPVESAIASLQKATIDWRRYLDHHKPTGINGSEGFMEANVRFGFIGVLLLRVLKYHTFLSERWPNIIGQDCTHILQHDLIIDTESFYWQCGRFRKLAKELDGLAGFEAPGVRDVRNHLIEHPEGKSSRLLIATFSWDADSGPKIKAVGRPHDASQHFLDAGLFLNASRFYEELSDRIAKALPPNPAA
jgi:hypothetical protein